jgi:hypothetical protein
VRISVYAAAVSSVLLLSIVVGCGASSGTEARDAGQTQKAVAANIHQAGPVEKSATPGVMEDKPLVAAALEAQAAEDARNSCRPGMVSIEGKFCIDKYEASLVETVGKEEHQFSPYSQVHDEHVRAVSEPGLVPQGYISRNQAEKACVASGKRLCRVQEWQQACRGPENKQWGYGDERVVGRCNDNGKNPVMSYYGPRYNASTMNKPELNQMDGTLAKTGDHKACTNGYGVYDMVGNLHEWVSDPNGTFYGGYYQDVDTIGHGAGCGYKTTAHEARYHDYSTGFRCCADMPGSASEVTVAPAVDPPTQPAAPAPRPKKKKSKRR